MNILIVKLSAIGDVVHCLPMAAKIKLRMPEAKISWLVEPPARALLENNNAVDEVIVFNKKDLAGRLKRPSTLGTGLGDLANLVSSLKAKNFDLAIDAQGLLKSALLAWGSGAPVRVGFKGAREGSSLLMTDTLDVGDYYGLSRHVVDLNCDLADFALGVMAARRKITPGPDNGLVHFPLPALEMPVHQAVAALLNVSEADFAALAAPPADAPVTPPGQDATRLASAPGLLPQTEIDPGAPPPGSIPGVQPPNALPKCPIAVLIPGTTWVTKIWSAEHWVELGTLLLQAGVGRLIICGGTADSALNQSIYIGIRDALAGVGDERLLNLTAKTDLMQLLALFQVSDLVVGADTGPVHLAAASDRPLVVAVHGASPWTRNGPFGPKGRAVYLGIACQPCFAKTCAIKTIECLRDLPARKVLDTVREGLEALRSSR